MLMFRLFLFLWEVEFITKCSCGKEAVGVIPSLLGHRYVCKECGDKAEKEGWYVDYENWRLETDS